MLHQRGSGPPRPPLDGGTICEEKNRPPQEPPRKNRFRPSAISSTWKIEGVRYLSTGLSAVIVELTGKRLELLKEVVPGVSRIAVLLNLSNPNIALLWKEIEIAASSMGAQLQPLGIRKPGDFGEAFDAAIKQRAGALVVASDALTQANRRSVADLAAKHRLPAIYSGREFVDAGGLIAYGVSYPHLYRRAAIFVDKIFKVAKPGDLPVEQPTQFELVVNLKTANVLGLTIPQSILLRADEVIR